MRGRDAFTFQEASRIRGLLADLRRAERPEQKQIRRELRRAGFYISDFVRQGSPMTAADFDGLVERGSVRIDQR